MSTDSIKQAGLFTTDIVSNDAGTRSFKLYVPAHHLGRPAPLIVMLHGCTQSPDDFAVGSRMNELAEEYGCLVVYPKQSREANSTLCWNWYMTDNQRRDGGEPSIIADITRTVIAKHSVDEQHVYIVGMSAGGAMAVIMAAAYPELFVAVGIHSGIAYRAARNLFSALTAMKRGAEDYSIPPMPRVRAIVFHGDIDKKVHPRNGEQVTRQLLGAAHGAASVSSKIEHGEANGRRYDRTMYYATDGAIAAEDWVVHGTAHAWSGGNPAGSHVDPTGPDASREMLRFFLGAPVFEVRKPRVELATSLIGRYLRRFKILPAAK